MKRKIETGVVMFSALLLGSGTAQAAVRFGNPLGFFDTASVPEVDFSGLGSVGVGTLLMILGYTVRKGVRKITDRNRD